MLRDIFPAHMSERSHLSSCVKWECANLQPALVLSETDVFCAFHSRILVCTFISPRSKQMGTVYLFIQTGKCSPGKLWFGLLLRHHFNLIMGTSHLQLETSFRSGEWSHLCAWTCLYQFLRAKYAHLFSTLCSVSSHRQLEIDNGGNIYTTEIGKCCKSGLPSSPCLLSLSGHHW